MSVTETESKNQTKNVGHEMNVGQEIQDLKKSMEVQAATEAGAHATQAATHAGTWAAMVAGGPGVVVGMFLALALTQPGPGPRRNPGRSARWASTQPCRGSRRKPCLGGAFAFSPAAEVGFFRLGTSPSVEQVKAGRAHRRGMMVLRLSSRVSDPRAAAGRVDVRGAQGGSRFGWARGVPGRDELGRTRGEGDDGAQEGREHLPRPRDWDASNQARSSSHSVGRGCGG
jgi:hypothetical protein